ncbi:mitochondrial exoribonuclease DSS-1, putative [Bodo saltans]|uniref:Mitochondrial exoribonuclease DSS-1, putative n=1 Tax=Bodo saltans TaxID=75058 RepID=A0A0S4J212_BODSA|nr:mitochondrial exoribonuclease DSS-1, putative [Bodo saltans]|eukprot:CUG61792.1 mitochondrial exoribonuclease DSS-1, putative [Bodo saltans]
MLALSLARFQKARRATGEQFTGNYLDASWAKKFILGYVLQHIQPEGAAVTPEFSQKVLAIQQDHSEKWQLAAKPLDGQSSTNILRLIGRYACGQSPLSLESMSLLDAAIKPLGFASLQDPRNAKLLLERVGFLEPGDNLRRLVFRGDLTFPEAANSILEEHIDPTDSYDAIRGWTEEPIYAIDSASTSEVDDAIGVHYDDNGNEIFTVYVSDATVHCPYDSALERMTARTLTTTSYLPEQVYFMLPRPIVEAATLRADKPCRTFNITFRVDEASGELSHYSVSVGWVRKLRRITYDAVQELYDHNSAVPMGDTPSWATSKDIEKLHRIHHVARVRLQQRIIRGQNKIDSNLPDPLIKVKGTKVISVTDQILSTKDARIAVAELMIAANEVCSRVAQSEKIPIPYRGTRLLSRDHEVSKLYTEPRGVVTLASNVSSGYAESMFRSISALSSVTRAVYFHEPIFHSGLETNFYAHSTSPLRRYADMLVHHQLKVHVALKHGHRFDEMIPEYQMASLCSMASLKQEQAALLQDSSSRFWLLTYIWVNLLQEGRNPGRILKCLVGSTRDIRACPLHQQTQFGGCEFVSDIFIPEIQMTHTLLHSHAQACVGTTLDCEIKDIDPSLNVLVLRVVHVHPYEGSTEEILRQALIPASDS